MSDWQAPRRRVGRSWLLATLAVLLLAATVIIVWVLATKAQPAAKPRGEPTHQTHVSPDGGKGWQLPQQSARSVSDKGVPSGYDRSEAGAATAGSNVILAGWWFAHTFQDPWQALGALAADRSTSTGERAVDRIIRLGAERVDQLLSAHPDSLGKVEAGARHGVQLLAARAWITDYGQIPVARATVTFVQITKTGDAQHRLDYWQASSELVWQNDDWRLANINARILATTAIPVNTPLPAPVWLS